jgi:DUF4097 and DUF4098 domain-containing protein YvlB
MIFSMNRCFSLLAVFALFAGSARAETLKSTFAETHPFDPQGTIRLSNTNGSVTIRTWDRPEVRVEGEKRASDQETLDGLVIAIEATPQLLAIKTTHSVRSGRWFSWLWNWGRREQVEFVLTVPATVRLDDINTVNARVTIDGVQGPVEAGTVNGELRLTGLRSDAKLSTVNGSIRAEFAAVAPQSRLSFRTVNGGVTVALPTGVGATLDISTVNGGISCDFPITVKKSGGHHLNGPIGDGSASLKISTVNGGVKVVQGK